LIVDLLDHLKDKKVACSRRAVILRVMLPVVFYA